MRLTRLALCTALALVVAAGAAVALVKASSVGTSTVMLSGSQAEKAQPAAGAGGSASPAPPSSPSTNTGTQAGGGDSGPSTLAGVLEAADASVEGRGLLPAAGCNQYRRSQSGAIHCTAPVPGVAEITYQNYSSLAALYSAYSTQVAQLDGGSFRENTGTCGNSAAAYAEFGWNQEEGHPHGYTVAQMAAGQVPQIFAGGRMACFAVRTQQGVTQDIVWTINNGPAMGIAIGNGPARAVYQLWASLHHTVLFPGTEMCGTAERMNASEIPDGNLKVLPVCPAGVETFTGSSAP